jgi:hypothetical protein
MPVAKRSLLWRRLDTTGTEHALLYDGYVRGTATAATPVAYTLGYELVLDDAGATARLSATAEGAGWLRSVKLERAAGRWHVTAGEQGDLGAVLPGVGIPGIEEPEDLDDALDVDLEHSPLTVSLPLRRLGTPGRVTVARILVPGLEVVPAASRHAEVTVDADGYVEHCPGLAQRARG